MFLKLSWKLYFEMWTGYYFLLPAIRRITVSVPYSCPVNHPADVTIQHFSFFFGTVLRYLDTKLKRLFAFSLFGIYSFKYILKCTKLDVILHLFVLMGLQISDPLFTAVLKTANNLCKNNNNIIYISDTRAYHC